MFSAVPSRQARPEPAQPCTGRGQDHLRLSRRHAVLRTILRCAATLFLALFFSVAETDKAHADGPSGPFLDWAQVWLHGSEAEALAGLSDLAQAGDPAAQVLIGLIDKSPALQGPWLSRLPRGHRLMLMRRPGGLSGESWLGHARGDPVADTWLALLSVDASIETAARLAELGEARAAREAVLILAARERLDLSDGTDGGGTLESWPDWMDPELVYVVWRGVDEPRRVNLLALVPGDHPQRALMGEPVSVDNWVQWLRDSPAASPLRAVCGTTCPDTRDACLRAAYEALGSHNALLTLGSPVETLIPQDEFLAAPRGQTATLRRILLSVDARGRRAQIDRARQLDRCFAEVLAQESSRYRYIREGSAAQVETDSETDNETEAGAPVAP